MAQNGEFHVIWNSQKPITPEPLPPTRTEEEWELFLQELQKRWASQWESNLNSPQIASTDT